MSELTAPHIQFGKNPQDLSELPFVTVAMGKEKLIRRIPETTEQKGCARSGLSGSAKSMLIDRLRIPAESLPREVAISAVSLGGQRETDYWFLSTS